MKHLLNVIVYLGIGCAYQSTYDDVSVRQIATADVPISTFGHIFAWPFVVLYHMLGVMGWGFVVLIVVAGAVLFGLWVKDCIDRRARRVARQSRFGR